ncbi:MAG: ABC transporter permease [Thermomicrobiales bacterium]
MAQRTVGQRAAPVRVAESDLAQGGMARRVRRAVVLRRLLRHHGAVAGGVVLALLMLIALLAPLLAPYDPIAVSRTTLKPPSAQHLMGTDNIGRDILSRVIYGTRISLWMGFIAVGIAAVFGTAIGVVAGTYGKAIDTILMRFIDALMAFPGILLALTIAAVLGPGIVNAMVAVGIASIPTFARLVRSSVLQVKQTPYIEAARAIGCADGQLIRRHILPNVLTPVLVLGTLGIAGAILVGASLSFLGLGAQPPTAEWGAMLSQGRQFMRTAWWIMAFPGLAITITVMAANLVGDGLRDALDPRLKY